MQNPNTNTPNTNDIVRLIFIGDLVGAPGRMMFQKWAPRLREKYKADLLIVNGENVAKNGRGITVRIADSLREYGADLITTGNHVWGQKEFAGAIDKRNDIIRPANFPSQCPGKGYSLLTVAANHVAANDKRSSHVVAVVNMQGRVFMHENLECPFRKMESLLTFLKTKTSMIFVDFHAEATSEKQGFSFFLDGKVSGVFGTHTHVQTADHRILPHGSSYISDLGCSGALNSMLGMKTETVLSRFLTQMPSRFAVETNGPFVLSGVYVEVDSQSGKSIKIEPIRIIDSDLIVS